eukprot:379017-Pleurochrysis_carterae.AAC.1
MRALTSRVWHARPHASAGTGSRASVARTHTRTHASTRTLQRAQARLVSAGYRTTLARGCESSGQAITIPGRPRTAIAGRGGPPAHLARMRGSHVRLL